MSPPHAYLPPALADGRAWGFALNLYAVRSRRNWGIGDFTDLRNVVRWAASAGADTVGVSPLHALHYGDPEAASPYSPTSRYFLNPLFIDVEAVAEYATGTARALRERVASEPFARTLADLRALGQVAYARVARAKWSALAALYDVFRSNGGERRAAFAAFAERNGERLERFAVHEALAERFSPGGIRRGWMAWDECYRDASSPDVRAFAVSNRRHVDYFKYLQWVASEQLARAAEEARALALGLYLDVAVGADANGADVWGERRAYVLHETIGAPPDALGPMGQNWGLPPPEPQAMIGENGAFAELLAANMVHARALRLDHVMAMLRLFRIPRGKTAAEGTYVAYPFDDLLSVVRSQSQRFRCAIVGEDLGNVPDGFRERMECERILSYRLLLFERETDGRFRSPGAYPTLALATATTHDLPTLAGWALGRDVDARRRIDALPVDVAARAQADRRAEASLLLASLRDAGELDAAAFDATHRALDERRDDPGAYDGLIAAAYAFLASSRAKLVLVALDDAMGEVDQINLPGTVAEYPNWRRKYRIDIEDIARDARIGALAERVRERVKGSRRR